MNSYSPQNQTVETKWLFVLWGFKTPNNKKHFELFFLLLLLKCKTNNQDKNVFLNLDEDAWGFLKKSINQAKASLQWNRRWRQTVFLTIFITKNVNFVRLQSVLIECLMSRSTTNQKAIYSTKIKHGLIIIIIFILVLTFNFLKNHRFILWVCYNAIEVLLTGLIKCLSKPSFRLITSLYYQLHLWIVYSLPPDISSLSLLTISSSCVRKTAIKLFVFFFFLVNCVWCPPM